MFTRFITASLVLFSLFFQANAHAAISPALGVAGTPVRANTKRPSTNAPCGAGVNIAQALGSSKAVRANGNAFTVNVINFNGGVDGSRQVTARVDATGTGKSFVAATVTKNGARAPSGTGTEAVSVTLPAGTKCTGGAAKNLCVVQFKNASGFGNCVAVTQVNSRVQGTRNVRNVAEAVAEAELSESDDDWYKDTAENDSDDDLLIDEPETIVEKRSIAGRILV